MAGDLVQICLLGTRFSISTDETPEYIHKLVEDLSGRFAFVQDSVGLRDPLKVAILAGLFLEDELSALRRRAQKGYAPGEQPLFEEPQALSPREARDLAEAEKIALSLLENLDKTLKAE
jgi:cell division protein ZapA (FtsZ GTPase activity inhibitor)